MRILFSIVGLGVAALLVWGIFIFSSLGAFTSVTAADGEDCPSLPDIVGAEDIEPDYQTGFAYASSNDRRARSQGRDETGAIYRFEMAAGGNANPVRMTGTEELSSFHPHGIDLLREGGKVYLFAISHRAFEKPRAGHDVYVFEIAGTKLNLLHQFQDTGIRSPNDLAAVSLTEFYFTNDRGAMDPIGNQIEIVLARKISDVSFFDGSSATPMASMAFANGIRVSKDKKTVYASALRESAINVYRRDPKTNELTFVDALDGGTAPDNTTLGDDKKLWIASHANAMALTAHMADEQSLSPVRVFQLDPTTKVSKLIYEDDGSSLSGVSVAVPYKDTLFLGAIYEKGVLVCRKQPLNRI